MKQEIVNELLLNITPLKFWICFIVGSVCIVFRFATDLSNGIKKDPSTPYRWSWRHSIKGLFRFIGSLLLMALVVARFPEASKVLVDVQVPAGIDFNVGITIFTSAMFGFNIDVIWKKFVGVSFKHAPTVMNKGMSMVKKVTNGH